MKIIRRLAILALLAIPAVAFASDGSAKKSCCTSSCCPSCPMCSR